MFGAMILLWGEADSSNDIHTRFHGDKYIQVTSSNINANFSGWLGSMSLPWALVHFL